MNLSRSAGLRGKPGRLRSLFLLGRPDPTRTIVYRLSLYGRNGRTPRRIP